MKNNIYTFVGLFLFATCSFFSCKSDRTQDPVPENQMTLYCSPDLLNLTENWAAVFCKLNPDVEINVIKVKESAVTVNQNNSRNLGFFMDDEDMTLFGNSPWREVVGRDVIVSLINSENPYANQLYQQGISPEMFAQVLRNEEEISWGSLLNDGQNVPVHLYVVDDATIHSGMAEFIDWDQLTFYGTKVKDGEELISAIQKDPYSMGIGTITNAIDYPDQQINNKIKIVPIDGNGNGRIDYKENIYNDLGAFNHGVWIGKYPRPLINNMYSVSTSQPRNKYEVAFLKWILTSGQQLLDNYGYNDLENSERRAKVALIDNYDIYTPANSSQAVVGGSIFTNIYFLAFLTLIGIVLFLTIAGILVREKGELKLPKEIPVSKPVFSQDFLVNPKGLYYHKSHTWAFMNNIGIVKIGVDDFLQHVTGPITNIKMKNPGEKIKKGKQIFSIVQEGKQLDIYAPISGIIIEHNKSLLENSSLINSSPYSEGWVYKIEPTNWLQEIQYLFMGNRYREWLKSEFIRLKEFFTDSLRPEYLSYAHVLQDGGELTDHLLKDLGPEVWEDFQTNFIDVYS